MMFVVLCNERKTTLINYRIQESKNNKVRKEALLTRMNGHVGISFNEFVKR